MTEDPPGAGAPAAKSVTIIVPALNEERNLADAVANIRRAVEGLFDDREILVFDDGSTDHTGEIADRLGAEDPRLSIRHHSHPKGLGAIFKAGVEQARMTYVIMIHGDNETHPDSIRAVLERAGRADLIIPFTINPEIRSWVRQRLSTTFTGLVNLCSGLRLRYYNHIVLYRTSLIRSVDIRTDGFGFQAEALVRLLRLGASYEEIGVQIQKRPSGSSKAFRLKNVLAVSAFLVRLAWRTRVKRASSEPEPGVMSGDAERRTLRAADPRRPRGDVRARARQSGPHGAAGPPGRDIP
jgi:glycosyltransferase involved in cell wall biosynthesis